MTAVGREEPRENANFWGRAAEPVWGHSGRSQFRFCRKCGPPRLRGHKSI